MKAFQEKFRMSDEAFVNASTRRVFFNKAPLSFKTSHPTTPTEGDCWYNPEHNELKIFLNGCWAKAKI